ncbi:MAG: serine/threonine protein kinase [Symploca sp. SIO2E6]|nr:serine/threonine protein kinase [Symploca sp. SIO2E6]
MNFTPGNMSSFHSDILQETTLGQLCGSQKLFRDRYRVLRMIGRGGFGVTFLAKDISLPGKPLCVIKQLCPKFSDPPGLLKARKRFEKEATTLGKLGSHSQIPMLLDYFVVDGDFFLIQEYIRGMTLARQVRRQGCLTQTAAQRFLREMLLLLEYVHSHQVIHRDIKPQNIIRSQEDGRLVLIDFGAVKEQIAQAGDTTIKNPTTQFVGTMGFAPPEQFALRPVFSSDIYALGVTCLYLLTRKSPLEFRNDHYTGEIHWQNFIELSEPLGNILGKMMQASLQERYQSVRDILQDLDTELPQNDLADCLVNQVQSPKEKPASSSDQPCSPAVKTAIAIKEWKERKQRKQRRYKKKRPIVSTSGSSS